MILVHDSLEAIHNVYNHIIFFWIIDGFSLYELDLTPLLKFNPPPAASQARNPFFPLGWEVYEPETKKKQKKNKSKQL